MSDTNLNSVIQYGTAANRALFTPDPAVGSKVLYIWYDSDAAPATWIWNGSAWVQINVASTGDVAGPSSSTNNAIAIFDSTTGKLLKTNAVLPFYSVQVFRGSTSVTFNVNSTSYIGVIPFEFTVDMAVFPFTHYRILISGSSSEVAQSVTAQLTIAGAPTVPMHTGGNDVVALTAGSLYDSGWLTRDVAETGVKLYDIALKGSNGTVDLWTTYVEVLLKVDP